MKKKLVLWYPKPYSHGLRSEENEKLPPLGLGVIAALTPDDWDVVIRDANFDKFEVENCDMVGISAMTCQILSAYEIATEYRKKNIPVVLGGPHPTICPDEGLEYADVVVKGEAELIWKDVLNDFENGTLKRIYEADGFHDLKNMPKPSIHLYNPKYKLGLIQTTRGCAMDCEFCSVTTIYGGTYRKRPVEEVLDEIEMLPQRLFMFADDNLIGFSKEDHERFVALCQGMIDRKIKKYWISQVPIQFSQHEHLMKIAKKAGAVGLLIGIESTSQDVLEGNMGKKMNVRYIQQGDFVKRMHKNGIVVMGMFIVGNDEDRDDCFARTLGDIKRFKIDIPGVNVLTPYPGTKLWKRLEKEGRLYLKDLPQDWKYIDTMMPLFETRNIEIKEFQNGIKWLGKKVYSRRGVWFRALRALLVTRSLNCFFNVLYANLGWRHDELPKFLKAWRIPTGFPGQRKTQADSTDAV